MTGASGSRTVVVGGGLIGLSIARALAERGAPDVLVPERNSLASGGTGKSDGPRLSRYRAGETREDTDRIKRGIGA